MAEQRTRSSERLTPKITFVLKPNDNGYQRLELSLNAAGLWAHGTGATTERLTGRRTQSQRLGTPRIRLSNREAEVVDESISAVQTEATRRHHVLQIYLLANPL
jgi:hypothetical protein